MAFDTMAASRLAFNCESLLSRRGWGNDEGGESSGFGTFSQDDATIRICPSSDAVGFDDRGQFSKSDLMPGDASNWGKK